MNGMWDTFAFFEELLAVFPETAAFVLREKATYEEQALEAARLGFVLFCSPNHWGQSEVSYVQGYTQGDYSKGALDWYEENAEAVGVFALFAIGSLIAKRGLGQIDKEGFLLGQVHLPGFLTLRIEDICRCYSPS